MICCFVRDPPEWPKAARLKAPEFHAAEHAEHCFVILTSSSIAATAEALMDPITGEYDV